jgi:hypothetical protein
LVFFFLNHGKTHSNFICNIVYLHFDLSMYEEVCAYFQHVKHHLLALSKVEFLIQTVPKICFYLQDLHFFQEFPAPKLFKKF